jgi:amino acid adenylation domain-containing protein
MKQWIAMSPQQRTKFLAAARAGTSPSGQPIARMRQDGRSIASFSQQQQWFLDRIVPGDAAAYVVPFALRLRGPLDLDALRSALRGVVQRHDVLRCHFAVDDGELCQIVAADVDVVLPVEEIGGATAQQQESRLWQRAAEIAAIRFVLTRGPLLRTTLLRLTPRDAVLVWVAHHAVADGTSIAVLLDELRDGYAAAQDRTRPAPRRPALQYADLADWQRERLTADRMEQLAGFWRTHLVEAPAAALPADHPRPGSSSFCGDAVPFELPAHVVRGLTALAGRTNSTTFAVLFAVLHAALARFSGQPDAVLGVAVAGRDRSEAEALIGPFATTVPVRIDASGDPTGIELVSRVSGAVLDALSHQEMPFGHLVRSLGKARDAGHNPLYDVLFGMDALEATDERAFATELTVQPSGLPNGTARLDLQLTVEQGPGAWRCRLDYSTDLYERSTTAGFVEAFKTLLAEFVAGPQRPLSEMSLLDSAARDRVLEKWHRRASSVAPAVGFLEMFADQVGADPDRVAAVQGPTSVTYRQLDKWSNRVAHALRTSGATDGAVVGVMVDRTVEVLAAILGVLKAGAVYLPLDPSYPQQRLEFMLRDSGIRVLLHQTGLADRLLAVVGADVDLDGDLVANAASDPLTARAAGRAYVMYTSGSTGPPKGVVVGHRALGSFLATMTDLRLIHRDDVIIALTNLTFDISLDELLLPLAAGATVVVALRAQARSGPALRDLIDRHEVTVLHGTPATCRLLIDSGWHGGTVQRVLCGGETMSARLAADLQSRVPEVWNLFGPTEATVWSLAHHVTEAGTPAIGRPLANTTALVLDDQLRPVPPGVIGELYLGGAGLAEGYLNRDDLTAERFVTDIRSLRLYRTGDRTSYRSDGVFRFHGRVDNQVKLRGYRVELGEVEAALLRHPAVVEAVALVHEPADDDGRLVAFVRTSAGLDERALQTELEAQLPGQLVPSRIEHVTAFPLTSSGKIDRRALLKALRGVAQALPARWDPPVTSTQRWIADHWQKVLGGQRIGLHDNFFTIGGHSLLAVKILAEVEYVYGVQPSLERFFETPTVAGLAGLLQEARSAEVSDDQLLRRIEDLTDEQVAELMSRTARLETPP